ncbi:uncharacterized protein LOC107473623 [Arachis duranensis]|uniref:Uncharacterized protein LOC107473623 n=1 Tax=Arachis duranensis TaxID=130453 RepID=A0A6P4CBZ3_ARADU|nr:uncharacterized protein LOC107473623 [Arachis duranensis]
MLPHRRHTAARHFFFFFPPLHRRPFLLRRAWVGVVVVLILSSYDDDDDDGGGGGRWWVVGGGSCGGAGAWHNFGEEGIGTFWSEGRSEEQHFTEGGISGSKFVKKLFYKIPIAVVSIRVQYDTFVLAADEDIRVLFHCVRSFPEVRIHELFAKLDVGVDSFGASAPLHNSSGVGGASCSMPVIAPSVPLVASPSFAADLDRMEAVGSAPLQDSGVRGQAYEVGTGGSLIPDVQGFGEPDRVENAMCDDESDQEPVDIIGDSDDDTAGNPPTQHGASSSGTQQYPPHFSTLNLEALGEQAVDGGPTDYNIRRGVEYRVIESDHLKYHEKYKEFGKGCTWLIRVVLRARKGTWEVRRYNGPHTYLATSISSDHRQLDYHIICARILPLIRTDAAVTVKVLQQATEADYGFRPSYRKVWLAKQKAVA